jgi:hypothetical protein
MSSAECQAEEHSYDIGSSIFEYEIKSVKSFYGAHPDRQIQIPKYKHWDLFTECEMDMAIPVDKIVSKNNT